MHIESSTKLIRWVLSHLTLFTVLCLILYVYWNRSEFWPESWPDNAEKPPRIETSDAWTDSEKKLKRSGPTIVEKNLPENETSSLKYGNIVIQPMGDDKTLLYPGDVEDTVNVTRKASNQGFDTVNIKNSVIDSLEYQNETSSYNASVDFSESMGRYKQGLSFKQQKAAEKASNVFQQVTEKPVKYPDEEEINTAHIKPKAGSFQDKKLQAQIYTRQKQLQNQMISLIPISKKKGESYDKLTSKEKSEVKPVFPLTEAAEQQKQ